MNDLSWKFLFVTKTGKKKVCFEESVAKRTNLYVNFAHYRLIKYIFLNFIKNKQKFGQVLSLTQTG